MTKFADQLYDDLMRQHGPRWPTPGRPRRRGGPVASRRALLAAGAGGLAVAATVAGLVAGSGSPAYALTTNSDGTITLAIYQASGIAQANAKLHQLGDRCGRGADPAGVPAAAAARRVADRASWSAWGSAGHATVSSP